MLEKRFYKIGEVSDMLDIPESTLRYWEKELIILSPARAQKGHRRYTPEDIEKIRKIYYLVKEKGLKVGAAQEELHKNPSGIDYKFRAIERLRSLKQRIKDVIEALDK